MGFLPLITDILDSVGNTIAKLRSDGTRAPMRVKLGSGLTATSTPNGGTDDIELSAFGAVADVAGAGPIHVTGSGTKTVSIDAATISAAGSFAANDKIRIDNIPIDVTAAPYNAPRSLLGPSDGSWAALGDASVAFMAAWNAAKVTGRPIRTPNGYYKLTASCLLGVATGTPMNWDGDNSVYVWEGSGDPTGVTPVPMLSFGGLYKSRIGNFNIRCSSGFSLDEAIRISSGGIYDETARGITSSTDATPIEITTSINHGYSTGDIVLVSNHATNTNANKTGTNAGGAAPYHLAQRIHVTAANKFTLDDSIATGGGAGSGGTVQRNTAATSFHARFHDIEIDGTNGIETGVRIGSSDHGGLNLNNDFHSFYNVHVISYRNAGFEIQDTQVFGTQLRSCFINGSFITSATATTSNSVPAITIVDGGGAALFHARDVGKVIEIAGALSTGDGVLRGFISSVDVPAKTVTLRNIDDTTGPYNTGTMLQADIAGSGKSVTYGSQVAIRAGGLLTLVAGGQFRASHNPCDTNIDADYVTGTGNLEPTLIEYASDGEASRKFLRHRNTGGNPLVHVKGCRFAGLSVRDGDYVIDIRGDGYVVFEDCHIGDVDSAMPGKIRYSPSHGDESSFVFKNCLISSTYANLSGVGGGTDPLFPFSYPTDFENTYASNLGVTVCRLESKNEIPFTVGGDTGVNFYAAKSFTVILGADTTLRLDKPGGASIFPRSGLGGGPMRLRFRGSADALAKQLSIACDAGTKLIWQGEGPPLVPTGYAVSSKSEVYRDVEFWYDTNGSKILGYDQPVILARTINDVVAIDYVVLALNATEFVLAWPIPKNALSDFEIVKVTASHSTNYAEWTGARSVVYLRDSGNTITVKGSDIRGTLTGVNGGTAAAELADMNPDINDATSVAWTIDASVANNQLEISVEDMPAGTKVTIWMRARWRPT